MPSSHHRRYSAASLSGAHAELTECDPDQTRLHSAAGWDRWSRACQNCMRSRRERHGPWSQDERSGHRQWRLGWAAACRTRSDGRRRVGTVPRLSLWAVAASRAPLEGRWATDTDEESLPAIIGISRGQGDSEETVLIMCMYVYNSGSLHFYVCVMSFAYILSRIERISGRRRSMDTYP